MMTSRDLDLESVQTTCGFIALEPCHAARVDNRVTHKPQPVVTLRPLLYVGSSLRSLELQKRDQKQIVSVCNETR